MSDSASSAMATQCIPTKWKWTCKLKVSCRYSKRCLCRKRWCQRFQRHRLSQSSMSRVRSRCSRYSPRSQISRWARTALNRTSRSKNPRSKWSTWTIWMLVRSRHCKKRNLRNSPQRRKDHSQSRSRSRRRRNRESKKHNTTWKLSQALPSWGQSSPLAQQFSSVSSRRTRMTRTLSRSPSSTRRHSTNTGASLRTRPSLLRHLLTRRTSIKFQSRSSLHHHLLFRSRRAQHLRAARKWRKLQAALPSSLRRR